VAVSNKVFEGERKMSEDNRMLGMFELSGFPAMPRGVAQIEVTFDLDANGILSVSARETTSGKKAQIRIENKDKLSDEQVDRMVKEAEDFKDDDQKALERVEARTALESYIHQVKGRLRDKELRGRMEEDDAASIQADLRAADDWIDSVDGASREEYEEKLQELQQVSVGPLLEKYGDGSMMGGEDDEYSALEHEEL